MSEIGLTRRGVLGGLAGAAALGRSAQAQSPVTLNVIDVGGQLALVRAAIDAYQASHPQLVSHVAYAQAPAPELPGKIRAQQSAGRVDIDLVLTGTDGLSAGIQQGLWEPLVKNHAASLPKLQEIYQPAAWAMQQLAEEQAVCSVFCPAGPLLEYMPDRVKQPPDSVEALLEWTRANPGRFFYARPANSGPGRTWLQGLPYLLGDKDPKDPKEGWAKTWSYLAELGKNIEYYPSGTTVTMKELAEGSRDMIVTMTGWDINPRAVGVVPKEAAVGTLKGFRWVTDAQYFCVPKGVAPEKLPVLLDLTSYMLTPQAQAFTYDTGFFYPGPAARDVPLSMAPEASQKVVAEFGRPFYDKLIDEVPKETPLPADKLVYAFSRWDQEIGAKVGK